MNNVRLILFFILIIFYMYSCTKKDEGVFTEVTLIKGHNGFYCSASLVTLNVKDTFFPVKAPQKYEDALYKTNKPQVMKIQYHLSTSIRSCSDNNGKNYSHRQMNIDKVKE